MLPRPCIIFSLALLFLFAPAVTFAQRPELVVQTGHSDKVHAVAFSPDGRLVASMGGNALKLWDVSTGHELRAFKDLRSGLSPAVAFSPDGKVVAGAHGGTVIFWDVISGQ